MIIELKKLKIANHLSEETIAFSAEVWVDGVLAAYAKNQGCGGCNHYDRMDHAAYDKFVDEAKRLHRGMESEDALVSDLMEAEEDKKIVLKYRKQGYNFVVKVMTGKSIIPAFKDNPAEEYYGRTYIIGYTAEDQLPGILQKNKAEKHIMLYGGK